MPTDIAQLGIKIEATDIKAAVRELNKLEKQSGKNERANKGLSNSFGILKGAVAAIGIGALLRSVVGTSAAFEKMNASLVTVTGSAENATMAMDGIIQFATETPYQVGQITEAFIKLKALGLDPSREALLSYGNTASAMGKDLNQMIEAVADATTGEFERLKEFGIKSRSEGDRVSFTFQGITTTVRKSADEISDYLQGIGKVQFAGAMEKQMNTIDGAFSNFSDSVDLAIKKLTEESGFNEALKAATKHTALFIRRLSKTQTISDFDTEITKLQGTIDIHKKNIEEASKSNKGFFSYFEDAQDKSIIQTASQQIGFLTERIIKLQAQSDILKAKSGGLDADKDKPKGAVDTAFAGAKDLEKLQAKYGDELRLLAEKQNSELMLIQEAFENKALTEREAEELRLNMTAEFAEKRTEIARKTADEQQRIESSKTQMMISMASNVTSAASAFLNEMPGKHKTAARAIFLVEKGAAMAQAYVNTQAAAVKALALDPTGNLSAWVTKLGYTAIGLMGATALVGVGNVGGGGAGGSAPAPASQPDLGAAPPDTNFNQPITREARIVIEGAGPHTDSMRQLLMDLIDTKQDMGMITEVVFS